jgi:hypothetical protein
MRDSEGASKHVALARSSTSTWWTEESARRTRHCCSVRLNRFSEGRKRFITASRATSSAIGSDREKLLSLTLAGRLSVMQRSSELAAHAAMRAEIGDDQIARSALPPDG